MPVLERRIHPCVSLDSAALNELVAQLVEQRPFKAWVVRSNRTELTTPGRGCPFQSRSNHAHRIWIGDDCGAGALPLSCGRAPVLQVEFPIVWSTHPALTVADRTPAAGCRPYKTARTYARGRSSTRPPPVRGRSSPASKTQSRARPRPRQKQRQSPPHPCRDGPRGEPRSGSISQPHPFCNRHAQCYGRHK